MQKKIIIIILLFFRKVVPSHIKKLIELPPTSNRIAERHLFVKLDEELTAGQNTDNNCYLRIYNEETINRVKVCQKAPICGDDEFFRNRELREQRVEKKRGKVLSEPFTSNGFHDTREHLEEIEKRMCQLATAEIQSFPSISSAQPIQHHYQFEEMVCTDVENYQRQQPPQLQRTN
uniref:Uncharacterized protein n=1 Tax=Caenorhabditis japonica TaxID=281687 RepID=A0A8R1HM84_CAEJA